jgi:hypothetical protein
MTRTKSIATIAAIVADADDAKLAAITQAVSEVSALGTEGVRALGELIRDMKTSEPTLRQLAPREFGLIAQSKADFAAGHTYDVDEAFAQIEAGLAARRAACVLGRCAGLSPSGHAKSRLT